MTEAEVGTIFLHTIEGLAKAHAAGIVHRDVKPGNLIFRKSDQRLVFVDFGLAVGVEDFGQTKVSGISIQFAAPEQHYGEPATQASDVFSLCAVIHYAVHYDKPDLRKPNRFAPGLAPEKLRDALTRGLKVNVEERFRDGRQLLQALVTTAPHLATPPPIPPNAEPAARKVGDVIKVPPPSAPPGRLPSPVVGKVGDVIEVPLTASLKMRFAWVPPGTSWLGGGGGKPGQQQFTLAKGLWCGVYPVTQAEWQAIMGDNPSHFTGLFRRNRRHPVEQVSWNRVQQFLEALNGKQRERNLLYRLPTEQEWEYICRGGPISQDQSNYHFYFARSKNDLTPAPTNDLSSTQANFDGNYQAGSAAKGPYRGATIDVGMFLPNPLGIYDLHGNVWEWTSSQEYPGRVFRGGSWSGDGLYCAASNGRTLEAKSGSDGLGFRLLAVPVGG